MFQQYVQKANISAKTEIASSVPKTIGNVRFQMVLGHLCERVS